ncbi:ferredoxin [Candidatus Aenigmatarchaeota archaeon]
MVKTYIIQYDREGCIGAASCTHASKEWVLASDSKADLKDSKEVDEDLFEREITEAELAEHLEAAKSCPTHAIKIIEKETKKKIF